MSIVPPTLLFALVETRRLSVSRPLRRRLGRRVPWAMLRCSWALGEQFAPTSPDSFAQQSYDGIAIGCGGLDAVQGGVVRRTLYVVLRSRTPREVKRRECSRRRACQG